MEEARLEVMILGVIRIKMVFSAVRLDEITKKIIAGRGEEFKD